MNNVNQKLTNIQNAINHYSKSFTPSMLVELNNLLDEVAFQVDELIYDIECEG